MRDKVIEVLGLGPSIQEYEPRGNQTIGVNDIFKFHKVDKLLLLDLPENFETDRLEIIRRSVPEITYSDLLAWHFMPGYTPIQVADASMGGDISTLDDWNCLPRHVDSTFTATCMAYHFGASDIVLYGVDFKDHHLEHYSDQIIRAYSRLHAALIQRGVLLWVGTDKSLLSRFIPNWQKIGNI